MQDNKIWFICFFLYQGCLQIGFLALEYQIRCRHLYIIAAAYRGTTSSSVRPRQMLNKRMKSFSLDTPDAPKPVDQTTKMKSCSYTNNTCIPGTLIDNNTVVVSLEWLWLHYRMVIGRDFLSFTVINTTLPEESTISRFQENMQLHRQSWKHRTGNVGLEVFWRLLLEFTDLLILTYLHTCTCAYLPTYLLFCWSFIYSLAYLLVYLCTYTFTYYT